MNEVWKDIPGYEGKYQASSLGRIKSFVKNKEGRIMSPNNNGKGYLSVMLGKNNRHYIHTLVLETFLGPSIFEVNHKNLIKADNTLNNLEYVTRAYNQRHMILGGKHNKVKLSKENRLKIKELFNAGKARKELAKQLNVSKSTISSIINNKTWSWE